MATTKRTPHHRHRPVGAGVVVQPDADTTHPLRSKLNWPFPKDWRDPPAVKRIPRRARLSEVEDAPY